VAFVLTYEGSLPSRNSESGLKVKNLLRRAFDPQIREFCQHDIYFSNCLKPEALTGGIGVSFEGVRFLPLVSGVLSCELTIEVLRRDPPGSVFSGGDLDARLKTLFDGLRMPQAPAEVHGFTDTPFVTTGCLCLLADDSLISGFQIQTHRLLRPQREHERKTDVEVRIQVEIRQERRTLF
jgi:hypothetical protein